MPLYRKKVALISVHGDPLAAPGSIESGGQNIYVYNLAKHLARLGWMVDVFSRFSNAKKKQIVILKNKQVCVIRLTAGPKKFLAKDEVFLHLPEFLKNFLAFYLKTKEAYSIIHSNYWLSGWVGMQLKRILNIPLTHTFHSLGFIRHNTLRRFNKSGDTESELFRRRVAIEREIIAVADKLITTNTYERRDLIKYYEAPKHKLRVIPVGVNQERFKPVDKQNARVKLDIPKKHRILLYVGRLEWRKGIYTLLDALEIIVNKMPIFAKRLHLFVVGGRRKSSLFRDKEYQEFKKEVDKRQLSSHVVFTGGVRQRDLADYYGACDIVIIPSYYEPFGITPLEAMSMQIPVIASRTGGLQYTISHNKTGLLVPPHRAKVLANRIVELFRNKRLYKTLQKRSRERVLKHFLWPKIAKKVNDFYIGIIKVPH